MGLTKGTTKASAPQAPVVPPEGTTPPAADPVPPEAVTPPAADPVPPEAVTPPAAEGKEEQAVSNAKAAVAEGARVAEETAKTVSPNDMGSFRASRINIRDPHTKVMFYCDRDTPSKRTDWVKSQVAAKVLIEAK